MTGISVAVTLSRPAGSPASSKMAASSVPPVIGVSSCGLMTTPLPVARAGATPFMVRKNGKLNGLMTPTTPRGLR